MVNQPVLRKEPDCLLAGRGTVSAAASLPNAGLSKEGAVRQAQPQLSPGTALVTLPAKGPPLDPLQRGPWGRLGRGQSQPEISSRKEMQLDANPGSFSPSPPTRGLSKPPDDRVRPPSTAGESGEGPCLNSSWSSIQTLHLP